jgi:hypothetical protein
MYPAFAHCSFLATTLTFLTDGDKDYNICYRQPALIIYIEAL